MLILIIGLPGTGKTTFAQALASAIDAQHINSDRIRKQLGKRGLYDTASKKAVYDDMLRRTTQYIKESKDTIVDSTLYKRSIREPFLQLAAHFKIPLRIIELKAAEKTIQERVRIDRPYSEADFAVYQKIKAAYEPPLEDHLELWSDQMTLEEMVEVAKEYIGG